VDLPILDRLRPGTGPPCALCTQLATWVMHDERRNVYLCAADASTVLFSSIVVTTQLLRHLDPNQRNSVIMVLWPIYKMAG
jgi:hypothetical protein